MASIGVFDTVLIYSFIKRLVTPFKNWKAFKTGVIDQHGNIKVDKKHRSVAQNKSFKIFDLMILNLKKLLAKIPGGKSRLASYSAALMLVREGEELNFEDDKLLWEKLESYFEEAAQFLREDAPTNCASSGEVAGLDDNPARNMKKKKKKDNVIIDPLLRRRKV